MKGAAKTFLRGFGSLLPGRRCLSPAHLLLGFVVLFLAGGAPGQEVSEAFALATESLLIDVNPAGNIWVAVGERGHVLRSEDGGQSWNQVLVPTRELLTAVSFAPNGRSGTAVGHNNTILTTEDGGMNWTLHKVKGEFPVIFLDTLWVDADTVFAVGAYGEFWESHNRGLSWEKRWISEEELHLNTIEKSPDGTLYIAGESGTFLRSTDQGNEWEPMDTPYYGSYHGLLALSDQKLWVFGMRGHIYLSTDAGENWNDLSRESKVFLSGATRIAANRLILVGHGGILYAVQTNPISFSRHLFPEFDKMTEAATTRDGGLILTGNQGVHRLKPETVNQLFPRPE